MNCHCNFSLHFCCTGISGKSQVLFALVFLTRYLDLFTTFISPYNTIMKMFFIASSLFTVYLMFVKFKATYDANHDTFRIEFLVVPVGGLAFLVNHEFSPLEVEIFILHVLIVLTWVCFGMKHFMGGRDLHNLKWLHLTHPQ